MTQDASFIPPHVTPPDPPEAKAAALWFSIVMSLILIVFAVFICVEFFADMIGHPLDFAPQPPPLESALIPDQNRTSEVKKTFELISPKHQTQMSGPKVAAIYTHRSPDLPAVPPSLLLNGKPHSWEIQYGNNTWFAQLELEAGNHHLQVDEAEADFFVSMPHSLLQSLEPWAGIRPHPETKKTDRCNGCHEVFEEPTHPLIARSGRAIGAWKGIGSCFSCHEEEDHETRHIVVLPVSDQCLRCHTIH